LENNLISLIEGLDAMPELKILHLDNNMLLSVGGLDACTQLDTLQISGNQLQRIENLPASISTLNAAGILPVDQQ
jgi:Leucine-rich repeat (LRR) protein